MTTFRKELDAFTSSTHQSKLTYYLMRLSIQCISRIFYPIWAIVKHAFDQATRDKIIICTGSGTKEMLTTIDADQLPEFLGGELSMEEDPETLCLSTKFQPNWVASKVSSN